MSWSELDAELVKAAYLRCELKARLAALDIPLTDNQSLALEELLQNSVSLYVEEGLNREIWWESASDSYIDEAPMLTLPIEKLLEKLGVWMKRYKDVME